MIAFATAIADPEAYRRYAGPGLERAVEPGCEVIRLASVGVAGRAMNLLLDTAARLEDLEALVVVHQAVELLDEGTCRTVRAALADPQVAVAGCLGARNVRSLAWWEGDVYSSRVVHRYHLHGGGELPAYGWTAPAPAPAEVDALDGWLMVFSPWAVRELRFDEGLHLSHGYDIDYCLQAREAGRKVLVADIPVVRHQALELVEDLDFWVEAHVAFGRKWADRMPGVPPGTEPWRARARRAEAEREAARTVAYSSASELDARITHLEQRLAEVTDTTSWKVTQPLRTFNKWRRERRDGDEP